MPTTPVGSEAKKNRLAGETTAPEVAAPPPPAVDPLDDLLQLLEQPGNTPDQEDPLLFPDLGSIVIDLELVRALEEVDYKRISTCIDMLPNVDIILSEQFESVTLLFFAVKNNAPWLAKKLLDRGARLDFKSSIGPYANTLVTEHALRTNNLHMLTILLQHNPTQLQSSLAKEKNNISLDDRRFALISNDHSASGSQLEGMRPADNCSLLLEMFFTLPKEHIMSQILSKFYDNLLLIKITDELFLEALKNKECSERKLSESVACIVKHMFRPGNSNEVAFACGWNGTTYSPGHAIICEIKHKPGCFEIVLHNSGAGLQYHAHATVDFITLYSSAYGFKIAIDSYISPEAFLSNIVRDILLNSTMSQTPIDSHSFYGKLQTALLQYNSEPLDLAAYKPVIIKGQRSGSCAWKCIQTYIANNLSKEQYLLFKYYLKTYLLEQYVADQAALGRIHVSFVAQQIRCSIANIGKLMAKIDVKVDELHKPDFDQEIARMQSYKAKLDEHLNATEGNTQTSNLEPPNVLPLCKTTVEITPPTESHEEVREEASEFNELCIPQLTTDYSNLSLLVTELLQQVRSPSLPIAMKVHLINSTLINIESGAYISGLSPDLRGDELYAKVNELFQLAAHHLHNTIKAELHEVRHECALAISILYVFGTTLIKNLVSNLKQYQFKRGERKHCPGILDINSVWNCFDTNANWSSSAIVTRKYKAIQQAITHGHRLDLFKDVYVNRHIDESNILELNEKKTRNILTMVAAMLSMAAILSSKNIYDFNLADIINLESWPDAGSSSLLLSFPAKVQIISPGGSNAPLRIENLNSSSLLNTQEFIAINKFFLLLNNEHPGHLSSNNCDLYIKITRSTLQIRKSKPNLHGQDATNILDFYRYVNNYRTLDRDLVRQEHELINVLGQIESKYPKHAYLLRYVGELYKTTDISYMVSCLVDFCRAQRDKLELKLNQDIIITFLFESSLFKQDFADYYQQLTELVETLATLLPRYRYKTRIDSALFFILNLLLRLGDILNTLQRPYIEGLQEQHNKILSIISHNTNLYLTELSIRLPYDLDILNLRIYQIYLKSTGNAHYPLTAHDICDLLRSRIALAGIHNRFTTMSKYLLIAYRIQVINYLGFFQLQPDRNFLRIILGSLHIATSATCQIVLNGQNYIIADTYSINLFTGKVKDHIQNASLAKLPNHFQEHADVLPYFKQGLLGKLTIDQSRFEVDKDNISYTLKIKHNVVESTADFSRVLDIKFRDFKLINSNHKLKCKEVRHLPCTMIDKSHDVWVNNGVAVITCKGEIRYVVYPGKAIYKSNTVDQYLVDNSILNHAIFGLIKRFEHHSYIEIWSDSPSPTLDSRLLIRLPRYNISFTKIENSTDIVFNNDSRYILDTAKKCYTHNLRCHLVFKTKQHTAGLTDIIILPKFKFVHNINSKSMVLDFHHSLNNEPNIRNAVFKNIDKNRQDKDPYTIAYYKLSYNLLSMVGRHLSSSESYSLLKVSADEIICNNHADAILNMVYLLLGSNDVTQALELFQRTCNKISGTPLELDWLLRIVNFQYDFVTYTMQEQNIVTKSIRNSHLHLALKVHAMLQLARHNYLSKLTNYTDEEFTELEPGVHFGRALLMRYFKIVGNLPPRFRLNVKDTIVVLRAVRRIISGESGKIWIDQQVSKLQSDLEQRVLHAKTTAIIEEYVPTLHVSKTHDTDVLDKVQLLEFDQDKLVNLNLYPYRYIKCRNIADVTDFYSILSERLVIQSYSSERSHANSDLHFPGTSFWIDYLRRINILISPHNPLLQDKDGMQKFHFLKRLRLYLVNILQSPIHRNPAELTKIIFMYMLALRHDSVPQEIQSVILTETGDTFSSSSSEESIMTSQLIACEARIISNPLVQRFIVDGIDIIKSAIRSSKIEHTLSISPILKSTPPQLPLPKLQIPATYIFNEFTSDLHGFVKPDAMVSESSITNFMQQLEVDIDIGSKTASAFKSWSDQCIRYLSTDMLDNIAAQAEQIRVVVESNLDKIRSIILDMVNTQPLEQSTRARYLVMAELKKKCTIDDLVNIFLHQNAQKYIDETLLTDGNIISQVHQLIFVFLLYVTKLQHVNSVLKAICNIKEQEIDSLRNQELIELAKILTITRNFDAEEYADLLVFEYRDKKIVRHEQFKHISALLSKVDGGYQDRLLKAKMGGGKTSLILPYLAFRKADGNRLSMVIVPSELFATNRRDLAELSARIYNQQLVVLDFNRGSKRNPDYFRALYYVLLDAISERSYVLTTADSLRSLWLSLLEASSNDLLADHHKDEVDYLCKILSLLNTKCDGTFDEGDQIFSVENEFNYVLGEKFSINDVYPQIIDDTLGLFKFLNVRFGICDYINESKTMTDDIALHTCHSCIEWLIEDEHSVLYKINGIGVLDSSQKVALAKYLSDERSDPPGFVNNLSESGKERLAAVRVNVQKLLKITLAKHLNEDYGLRADSNYIAVPYRGANFPSERAEYASFLEKLNYSIQYHLATNLSTNILEKLLAYYDDRYKELASLISADEAYVHTSLQKLQAEFSEIFATTIRLERVTLTDIRMVDEVISSARNTFESKILALKHIILPAITVNPLTLNSNAQTLARILATTQIFSGTTFNYRSMTTLNPCLELSRGIDGEVIDCLTNNCNGVTAVDITQTDALHSLSSILVQMSATNPVHSLIDQAALFKRYTNKDVAMLLSQILDKSKYTYVLYFDHQHRLCALSTNDPTYTVVVLPNTEPETINKQLGTNLEQRFIYFDQNRSFGIDLQQPFNATGIVTAKHDTDLRGLLQAAMRLRALNHAQKVHILIPSQLTAKIHSIHDLIRYAAQTTDKQLLIEHYIAAKRHIDSSIAAVVVSILTKCSDHQQRIYLFRAFAKFVITENNHALHHVYGNASYESRPADELTNYANTTLRDWKSTLLSVENILPVTALPYCESEGIKKLTEEIQTIIDKLLPVCPETVLTKSLDFVSHEQVNQLEVEEEQDLELELEVDYLGFDPHDETSTKKRYIYEPRTFILPTNQSVDSRHAVSLNEFVKCYAGDIGFSFDPSIYCTRNLVFLNKQRDPFRGYVPTVFSVVLAFDSTIQKPTRYYLSSYLEYHSLEEDLKQGLPYRYIIFNARGDILLNSMPEMALHLPANHGQIFEQVAFFNGDLDLVSSRANWIHTDFPAKIDFFRNYTAKFMPNKTHLLDAFLTKIQAKVPEQNGLLLTKYHSIKPTSFVLDAIPGSRKRGLSQTPEEQKRMRVGAYLDS